MAKSLKSVSLPYERETLEFTVLMVFSVTLLEIDENKNRNRSIDKVENLGNERR